MQIHCIVWWQELGQVDADLQPEHSLWKSGVGVGCGGGGTRKYWAVWCCHLLVKRFINAYQVTSVILCACLEHSHSCALSVFTYTLATLIEKPAHIYNYPLSQSCSSAAEQCIKSCRCRSRVSVNVHTKQNGGGNVIFVTLSRKVGLRFSENLGIFSRLFSRV